MESGHSDPGTEKFPRLFGNYVLLHRLASGGMGSVYLARRDMSEMGGGIEKHCIVKTLKVAFTEDPEYVSRFIDEARVVVQLSHRNICQVFDVGKVGMRHYLAMEYVGGVDLKTLTERLAAMNRTLPEAIALHLAIEALDALDYAHRHEDPITGKRLGLVHRDVSPQNVMVNFEGEVKLIDFGLAASQIKSEQTQPNMVMGKLAYMAPEHARGEDVDARSDMFALAMVLYELLSGERFYGDMPMQAIWRVAGIGGHRPAGFINLEPGLAQILDRALTANREQRTASCGALREELEEYVYKRGLRGGREKLRALMAELFADDRESSRRLLSSLGTVDVSTDKEPTEPTVTIAVAPSGGSKSKPHAAAPKGVIEPSLSALAPPKPDAPRRVAPFAAAAALVAVAAIGGLMVGRGGDDPVAIPPPQATPAPAPPPAAAPAPVIPVIDPPAPTPAPLTTPQPPASPKPKPKPKIVKPSPDATDAEKLKFLMTECPRAKCLGAVRELGKKPVIERTRAEITAYKTALNQCVDKCTR